MKKYYNLIALVFIVTGLSSCLKNKYNALDPDKSPLVVEFKNPGPISGESPLGATPYSLYEFATDKDDSEKTYTIQLSGANPASQDINVTVGTDPAAVAKFNASRNPTLTKYVSLPTNLYSILTPNVVIPKGQFSTTIKVKYNIPGFDYDIAYALPLSIKSTSFANISGNFGTVLINMKPKNDNDGMYKVTNISFNSVLGDQTAITPRTRYLVTAGKFKNSAYDPALGAYTFAIQTPTGASQYGFFSPVFELNAAGKVLGASNYFPLGGGNSNERTVKLDPTGVNQMTITGATSKVMEVSYIMTNKGKESVFITEKWEYVGRRP